MLAPPIVKSFCFSEGFPASSSWPSLLILLASQVDVVEAAYAVLRRKLGVVRDFASLQRAHQEFLATLRAKFYIDNLEISQVLAR